ncbi:hypothetical protein LCGC14_2116130, partial [marine sediment metagenome]
MPNRSESVGILQKHLVPICAVFDKDRKNAVYVATSFVVSIENQWFLVTAGHVAEKITGYLTDASFQLRRAFLYDSGGLKAKYNDPIPFGLTPESFFIIGNQSTLDYAVIYVEDYYRRLLEKNGIEPLNEQFWRFQPEYPEFYMLLGIPNQLISVEWNNDAKNTASSLEITATLYPVTHSPVRPSELKETKYPRWYGYISSDIDIEGVSGGPIFAFKRNAQNEPRYWLVGIQSTWHPSTKAIAACPAIKLCKYMAD